MIAVVKKKKKPIDNSVQFNEFKYCLFPNLILFGLYSAITRNEISGKWTRRNSHAVLVYLWQLFAVWNLHFEILNQFADEHKHVRLRQNFTEAPPPACRKISKSK